MDGAQVFSLFPVVTKSKAMERLSYQTTGRLKGCGEGMRFGCGSQSVLGPIEEPSSYGWWLCHSWGLAVGETAVGGGGVTHVPRVGLRCPGCSHGLRTPPLRWRSAGARNPRWPPSPSLGGTRAVGEEPNAKNSHGPWDLLFPRNQWN